MSDEEPRMDALPGGADLPSSITLARFVACRSQEIQIMKNFLLSQSGTKLAFQTLPKHMRRRTMSHNVKRLPRRLRQIHLNQMKKSGLPTKQKRPSRKFRRRPRNLIEEYTKRSNKRYKWLQTHIWHAKRFHMVEKWGYKLADSPCDKAFRACYRAMSQHCLLQDISYMNCIEIEGNREIIVENFKKLWLPNGGLSIAAKAYQSGVREGIITLYEFEKDKAIGEVNFHWVKTSDSSSTLWIWVHPAFYEITKNSLTKCFSNSPNININEIGPELCRFRLTGPLSNAVLHDSLTLANLDNLQDSILTNYLQENFEITKNQLEYWKNIKDVSSASDLFPHSILSLIVTDPRLNFPKKRMKSISEFKKFVYFELPIRSNESPLYTSSLRQEINLRKIPDSKISELQGELLVSELNSNEATLIPVILIQRPGNKIDNIGLGSGWDFIVPKTWAKPFWIAFVMRGARTGGLRETNSILFEMGKSQFLQPDTQAGLNEDNYNTKIQKDKFFKLPPNKRVNYNKFNIVTPFACNWQLLMKDWSPVSEEFTVLRHKLILSSIQNFLNSKTQFIPDYPKNRLIPVKLECEKRGALAAFSIICLPKFQSDFKNYTEPLSEDKLQNERKELRKSHQTILKKMRRKRKLKSKDFDLKEYRDILENYTGKMRSLWLPEATVIRNSCSREVIGFVTKGGFSFSLGKSAGTGFITSDCLPILDKFRNRVLVRNTNSRQYKPAKMSVILE